MNDNNIIHFGTVILRTPLLPYNAINSLIKDEPALKTALNHPVVQEALFLSSPDLYQKTLRWLRNEILEAVECEKLTCTLMKYLLRMSYRPTPFGMFAGVSELAICPVAEDDGISLPEMINCRRHVRLDMHFVDSWAKHIEKQPSIRKRLKYFPNNSLYRLGGQFRYVAGTHEKEHRKYHISAIEYSEFTALILQTAAPGKTIGEILQALNPAPEDAAQLQKLTEELINAQVLVSELEPSVTGGEMTARMIETLQNIEEPEAKEQAALLKNIDRLLKHINYTPPGNNVDGYQRIIEIADKTGAAYDKSKLLQADMSKPLAGKAIDKRYPDAIIRAINFLRKIYMSPAKTNLDAFREAFYKRYEHEEVPLAIALDTETGIGYPPGKHAGGIAPLTKDLNFENRPGNNTIEWSKTDDFLLKQYLEAIGNRQYSIVLNDNDADEISKTKPKSLPLPYTFSAIASFIYEGDQEYIQLLSAGGAGAMQLHGRFCHTDEKIHSLCLEIAKKEQELNPDAIIAEVIHIPQSRLGNILQRPALSTHEIPYLGRSSLDAEHQIAINDLMLSVSEDRIILRSKRLNHEIIPRLSSAHNFSFNSLPVYHFLCDLQMQGVHPSIGFNWGSLSHLYEFLPRVIYENVILSSATWHLDKVKFESIINAKEPELLQIAAEWSSRHGMPQFIALADGDNELVIDLKNFLSVKTLRHELKKRNSMTFIEFFVNPNKAFVKNNDGLFTHQLIFSFASSEIKKSDTHLTLQHNPSGTKRVKRTFIPGDEWVYYKVYCGQKTADLLLTDLVKPLVDLLSRQEIISQWFFIRYADPDHHLRVRFRLKEVGNMNDIVSKMKSYANPFIQQGFISDIQLSAYKRELERYGENTIHLAEQLFCNDSIAALQLQKLHERNEDNYWLSALLSVNSLLMDFGFNAAERKEFVIDAKNNFAREFEIDRKENKPLRLQLDKKYRQHKALIFETLSETNANEDTEVMRGIFSNRAISNLSIIAEMTHLLSPSDLREKAHSLNHMNLNRIFNGNSRFQEFVIYDFLSRYYISSIKQNEAGKKARSVNA